MPSKRAVLAELTAEELRANAEYYELEVADRRVKAQLVDALAGSRRARVDEILADLSRDRLKELCRAFDLDDSGREKVDLVGASCYRPERRTARARPVRRRRLDQPRTHRARPRRC